MRVKQRGFLLLSTVVVLALMSALALLLTTGASMDSARASSDAVAARAAYAAEAGLAHARWTLAQNGTCSGYTNLADTAFGRGGYRATLSQTDGSPVTVTATGWLDDGTQASQVATDIPVYSSATPATLTLQPGPEGIDTYIRAGANVDNNFGALDVMSLDTERAERLALLRFDLSALPAAAQIVSAELALWITSTGNISNGFIDVHQPIEPWFEGAEAGAPPTSPGATYNRPDGSDFVSWWTLPGQQYQAEVLTSLEVASLTEGWLTWDATRLVAGGTGSIIATDGVLLRGGAGVVDAVEFVSSDGDPALAPKLTIQYRCECGQICATDGPTEPLLLSTLSDAEIGGLAFSREDLVDYDPGGDVATLALDASALGLGVRIDALHELDNGRVVISTSAPVTLGGRTYSDADLIDYDPATGAATMFLDAAAHFQIAQNVTSLHLLDTGGIVLSTDAPARLGNVDFSERDLVEYDRLTGTASILFDGDATTLGASIAALHIFETGNLVLAADSATTLGGVSFGPDQLVEYDPLAGSATLYFDAQSRFTDAGEQIEALHVGAGSGSGAGPIAHWKLDETSGSIAADSAGGNDGSVSGVTSWTSGQIDNALDVGPGVVTVPHNDALSLTSMMTISAWFRTDNIPFAYRAMVSKENSPDTNNFWFGLFSNELTFGFWNGSGWDLVYATGLTLAANTWYHAAATFDAASNRVVLYLDGIPVFTGTMTGTPVTSSSPIRLGDSSSNEAWRGALDDVRIYDVALGAGDVAALAGAAPGGGGPGACLNTFADNFDSPSYGNSDGPQPWATDWLEINESDGPTSGDTRIDNADSNYHLRLQDNDGGGEGVQREADLSAYSTATLGFDYRRDGLDNGNDYITVEVSSNGGGSWTELDRFVGWGTDVNYTPVSYDITAFVSATTRVRFVTSSRLGGSDRVYIDNVQILACP